MLNLFYVELLRGLITTIRYPANFISLLFINTLMFYGLFLGAQYMSGQAVFGDTLDAMVVGYTAWVLVTRGLNKTPTNIQYEASTGVLESIFLSSFNKSLIYVIRGLSESIIDIFLIIVMLTVLVFLTDSSIVFPIAIILPITTLVFAAVATGIFAGGLALQWKRIGSMLPSIQFVLMFLMFAPFETWTSGFEAGLAFIAMWLPMVPSVILLRDLMVNEMPLNEILALKALANGVGYLALSAYFFHLMVNRAKKKGLFSGY